MRVLATLVMALIVACNRSPRTTIADREVIRADEIASIASDNAYDIVAKLRPEFLKARGPLSASPGRSTELPSTTVYVDGVEIGPAEQALPRIPTGEVHEIRFYRAADATTKYGSRHGGGVIEVTTSRVARPRSPGFR